MIDEKRFVQFSEAYRAGLFAAIHSNPTNYAMRGETEEAYAANVSAKMLAAIQAGGVESVNVTGSDGLKRACRILGIRHTIKAIKAFLDGEVA